jgi:hypothetical protein
LIDPLDTLRDFLLLQAGLVALTGQRIYAGRVYPPPSYQPGQYAICFNGRGGNMGYDSRLLNESYTFKCYGASPTHAMTLYRTLVGALHDAHSGNIRHAEMETSGYPLQEQEPLDWHFVLTYFRVIYNSGV